MMIKSKLLHNHEEIYEQLRIIAGNDFVSDDPCILVVHSRDQSPEANINPLAPEFVVLPKNEQEIQQILKLANQHDLPIIVQNTGINLNGACIPSKHHSIVIHLRRLNQIIKIDDLNMSVTIQPHVSFAELQVETMKKGLWIPTPGAPATVGVISNVLYGGSNFFMIKYGFLRRSIISMTWITPQGKIIKTGSPAINGLDAFWWNGPGPDLKGLFIGNLGELGICTEMTLKLYPWAEEKNFFRDKVYPTKIQMYYIQYENEDDMIRGLQELSRADIAILLTQLALEWELVSETLNYDELVKMRNEMANLPEYTVVVYIHALTSKNQLKYGRKVIRKIARNTNGFVLTAEQTGFSLTTHLDIIRSKISPSIMRYKGAFLPILFPLSSIADMPYIKKEIEDFLKSSSIGDPTAFSIQPAEMGHFAGHEVDVFYNQGSPEEVKKVLELRKQISKIKEDFWPSEYYWLAYHWDYYKDDLKDNYLKDTIKNIKNLFDPNRIMNPNKWYKD